MFRKILQSRNTYLLFSGGASAITYYSLADLLRNRHTNAEVHATHAKHFNNLEDLIKHGALDENTRNKVISERSILKEKFDEAIYYHHKSVDMNNSETAREAFKNNVEKAAREYDAIYDKSTDFFNNVKTKFLDDYFDNINELIQVFKDYVATLNIEQLLSLLTILLSSIILVCLLDILMINFGNEIINYLKLEDKFPKIAKYIRLRKKITNINIFINYLIIIFTLFFIMYVNFLVLTS